jgi:hypothetical protein
MRLRYEVCEGRRASFCENRVMLEFIYFTETGRFKEDMAHRAEPWTSNHLEDCAELFSQSEPNNVAAIFIMPVAGMGSHSWMSPSSPF